MSIPVRYLRRFHATATVAWLGLTVPTVTVWSGSIPWVAMMSVYAIVVSHASAWQGARAEDAAGPDS